jgi:hypothetical protein
MLRYSEAFAFPDERLAVVARSFAEYGATVSDPEAQTRRELAEVRSG